VADVQFLNINRDNFVRGEDFAEVGAQLAQSSDQENFHIRLLLAAWPPNGIRRRSRPGLPADRGGNRLTGTSRMRQSAARPPKYCRSGGYWNRSGMRAR